jgi:hypothetical protein
MSHPCHWLMAEQGGAAIGLTSTFGTGVALKGLQAIKASERLSGLFGKFTEAISRAQMPIGLELQAGRLYSGIPFDAVKWKGFGPNATKSEAISALAGKLNAVARNDSVVFDENTLLRFISDPDKGGKITAGALEELETAAAIMRSGKIKGALERAPANTGLDFNIGSIPIDVKAHRVGEDFLGNPRELLSFVGKFTGPNKDALIVLDPRFSNKTQLDEIVNRMTATSYRGQTISRDRIVIPDKESFVPITVDRGDGIVRIPRIVDGKLTF